MHTSLRPPSRHMFYECHLPVLAPMRENFQPLRKVLTIDIAFDQISMITFAEDKVPNILLTFKFNIPVSFLFEIMSC